MSRPEQRDEVDKDVLYAQHCTSPSIPLRRFYPSEAPSRAAHPPTSHAAEATPLIQPESIRILGAPREPEESDFTSSLLVSPENNSPNAPRPPSSHLQQLLPRLVCRGGARVLAASQPN
ncbi:hypothetical protein XA68_17502 [Ophiocordyceps unilateralis]|uniref:Uncharacterized protein n=1 Tax=Ophiocordyceps unilateralis TaxID=268505 RepID=A0A2A9PKI7_OPHUN|nr:hypothetical protein XA68_17502 [Ophiocordyceps unilateralis]